MTGQISGQGKQPRVPAPSNGVNVNRCSRPTCKNFNIPATTTRTDPCYTIVGNKKNGSSIKCKNCGGYYTVKSNQAVTQEIERATCKPQLSRVYKQDGIACSNLDCDNFGIHAEIPSPYYTGVGVTRKGNRRFKCKGCGKTFTRGSEKRRSHPQSRAYDNVELFKHLVNQTGINRAIELTGLAPYSIYKKIDMFYERCVYFLQNREERLKNMELPWMRIAVDRQEYQVNWNKRKDKRNVMLSAIGSADKVSRYIFGMDVNFDPHINLAEVAETEAYKNDEFLKDYNRTFSRIWTRRDYTQAVNATEAFNEKVAKALEQISQDVSLPLSQAAIASIQDEVATEYGVEVDEQTRFTSILLSKGAQVRSEYTMYSHFIKLESLIGHAEALRFYLDQDPGMNRACCLAFANQIQQGNTHVAFVRINKELTNDERRQYVNWVKKVINKMIKEGTAIDEYHAHQILVQTAMQRTYEHPGSSEKWFSVPVHRIYEAEKFVSILTDETKLNRDDLTAFLLDASLHPIDSFFQTVRRRVSMLERPVHSPSNAGRVWTGKSAYNPAMIHKLLQILRTYYNYCLVGKDKKTPAQRIGLAKGQVEIRKILYP